MQELSQPSNLADRRGLHVAATGFLEQIQVKLPAGLTVAVGPATADGLTTHAYVMPDAGSSTAGA